MSDRALGRYDVVVVGYGPVGAAAALMLAYEGLRVAVLERATEIYDLPRAVNLDGEIVRAFHRIGHGAAIVDVLQEPRAGDAVCFTDSKRRVLFGMDLEPQGYCGWPDVNFMDQPELEARLRELVDADDRIDVFLSHEVTGLRQRDDSVTVVAADLDRGDAVSVEAAYAVACDGASSFVRRNLGIEWASLGYDQDWLVVDVEEEPGSPLPLGTMQVCDPARLTTYVCVKDPNRRWEFRLLPGESRDEMQRPDKVRELLDPWAPPDQYRLRRAAVYQFHAANASRWRDGRVFLAGDAAHQTPPFLGQGLNSGVRDVFNLAWKLGRVLRGESRTELLDSYEAERDPHARDLVEWAVAIGRLMESLAAAEAGEATDPPDLSSGYGQGRVVPPLRDGVLVTEQTGDDGPAGGLLRQPRVTLPDGSVGWFDDALGAGFCVVVRSRAAARLSDKHRAWLERASVPVLALDEVDAVEGRLDSVLANHEAAIVRPDRYVFGAADDHTTLDDLVARLASLLA